MVRLAVYLLVCWPAFVWAQADCGAKDTGAPADLSVERINKRYDDFFRYQRELEERQARIDAGRSELRGRGQDRIKQLELARREFVKNRRPKPDNEAARLAYEASLKDRDRKIEEARRCYVQTQRRAEQILNRGRKIPELKEFGLEDYH